MIRNKPWIIIFIAGFVNIGIWIYALLPREPLLSLVFLDVGEGMCAIARTPSGKTMVVDCGTSSWRHSERVGEKLVAPYLHSLGIRKIDVAVLTHPHADHISGYSGLLRIVPAHRVLDIGAKHPSPYYTDFLKAIRGTKAIYHIARRGQVIDMGDGVKAQVLNPNPLQDYMELNDRSIVLRLVYGRVAFMITGDAGEQIEHSMILAGKPLRSQVLQVGHHGSEEASSPEWLSAVNPTVAVISCGRNNEYGHPSREVISRLQSRGVRVYRTDVHGAVAFTTNGTTITVRHFAVP
jgi:beta-lactamase superfamily II metal-dependent hydrolase